MSIDNQVFQGKNNVTSKEYKEGFIFKYVLSSQQATIKLDFTMHKDSPFSLKLFESSFDIFDHVSGVKQRSDLYMPEPFIITDATIIGQSIALE
jgi:hypothetical protein